MNQIEVDYSVVIPVYNSEKSLSELCRRLTAVFEKVSDKYEIIMVDDCSKDKSWSVMEQLHSKDKRVKVIQLMRNFGQHNALMCGFNYAKGKYVITMDDDLQHPPEEIPKLIKKITEGFDVVYGQYNEKKHLWFRNIGSSIINKSIKMMVGEKINVTTFSFRIISKDVIEKIVSFKNHEANVDFFISQLVSPVGIDCCSVNHFARKYGETNYNIRKLIKYSINMIFNFTILPLRVGIFIGLICSCISLSLGIYFFIQYVLNNIVVSGFTTLILSISFFSGVILFILGIIGEYIGRIYFTINNKPQFIVRKIK